MADEEIASLELDKLEASFNGKEKQGSTESMPEKDENPPAKMKPTGMQGRLRGMANAKRFIFSFILGAVTSGMVYYFVFADKTSPELKEVKGVNGRITYSGAAPMGFEYAVNFKLIVPFQDLNEKRALLEKLSKIRPELMALSQNPEITQALKEKDTTTLNAEVLSVASRVTGLPLDQLELTEFTLD